MLRRQDVVAYIRLKTLAPARSNPSLSCEMEDDVALAYKILQFAAREVDGYELEVTPLPCVIKVPKLLRAPVVVVEAVDPKDAHPICKQRLREVGSDESRAAGYER